MSEEIPVDSNGASELSEPASRRKMAERILANREDLSPRREAFAKGLLDDSYKSSLLFRIRSLVLERPAWEKAKTK